MFAQFIASEEDLAVAQVVFLFLAAASAGAINAVAGGGTLVTFPALLWVGVSEKVANATSTVALWPGSLGGIWGYYQDLRDCERWVFWLGLPSLLGGAAGAGLLLITPPEAFSVIVPYLILFATILFMMQDRLRGLIQTRDTIAPPSSRWIAGAVLFQSLVAVYGGYFGAGIGILMLSALSLLGLHNIHQMNGLKSLFALCINGVAAACFVVSGIVNWSHVLVMVLGSIVGGYGGARVARLIGQRAVRTLVVCIGLTITAVLLYHQLQSSVSGRAGGSSEVVAPN
jgi:hypothetical protein